MGRLAFLYPVPEAPLVTRRPTQAVQASPSYELVAGCPSDIKLHRVLICDRPNWGMPTVYVLTIAQLLGSLDLGRSLAGPSCVSEGRFSFIFLI